MRFRISFPAIERIPRSKFQNPRRLLLSDTGSKSQVSAFCLGRVTRFFEGRMPIFPVQNRRLKRGGQRWRKFRQFEGASYITMLAAPPPPSPRFSRFARDRAFFCPQPATLPPRATTTTRFFQRDGRLSLALNPKLASLGRTRAPSPLFFAMPFLFWAGIFRPALTPLGLPLPPLAFPGALASTVDY